MKSNKCGLGLIAPSTLLSVTSTLNWSQELKKVKNPQEIRAVLSIFATFAQVLFDSTNEAA